jgi:leader peptidase (prepilin peptidase)/N-methyltransferase
MREDSQVIGWILAVFSFLFGTIVGSFLNVVIYRLPRGLSVNKPKRSFCPGCEKQIPWVYNLPIVSWLWLRGKCAFCKASISPRYLLVELLTGVLFLAVWLHRFPEWQIALVLWVLTGLLIAATFIDFEHFIIPDEITWGGVVAGLLLSAAVPATHSENMWWRGLMMSAIGAAAGYGSLWLVVQAGKMAFGKYRVRLDPPEAFNMEAAGDDWDVKVGDDESKLLEVFWRKSDELVLIGRTWVVNGESVASEEIRIRQDRLTEGDTTLALNDVKSLRGEVREMIIPREAMGLGDVKFIACIGAFLGWQAVVFSIVASSIVGAVVGVTLIVTRGREKGGIIPFGPYLAFGALLWMFVGPRLVSAYLNWLAGPSVY